MAEKLLIAEAEIVRIEQESLPSYEIYILMAYWPAWKSWGLKGEYSSPDHPEAQGQVKRLQESGWKGLHWQRLMRGENAKKEQG